MIKDGSAGDSNNSPSSSSKNEDVASGISSAFSGVEGMDSVGGKSK